MYLPLNSQATVIDILRGIIIQSGNDASKAIAEHMASSEEGFAKLMNAEAQRLGMTLTHFVNPHGPARSGTQGLGARSCPSGARIIRDSVDYHPSTPNASSNTTASARQPQCACSYTDPMLTA